MRMIYKINIKPLQDFIIKASIVLITLLGIFIVIWLINHHIVYQRKVEYAETVYFLCIFDPLIAKENTYTRDAIYTCISTNDSNDDYHNRNNVSNCWNTFSPETFTTSHFKYCDYEYNSLLSN